MIQRNQETSIIDFLKLTAVRFNEVSVENIIIPDSILEDSR